MENIKTYDDFINEGVWDSIKSGAGKVATAAGSVLHKAMTTDKQRAPEERKAKEGEVSVDTKNKEMKTDNTAVATKVGRVIAGNNAFIDTKSGEIMAMDIILNEKELAQVIELWKKGDKKGSASILKNFAIRERNMQFNVAIGLMMSALCLGSGACIPKLKAQTQVIPAEVTEVIPTQGIGYKNALLKFYQALGDKVGIGTGNKFIKGSATKEELFNLFDTLAKKKGITTDEFMKQMFNKSHGGNADMVTTEMNYLAKCKTAENIKTVGQIFDKTNAQDMTGVKGFNPFGISSPKNATALQGFFNDIEGIGKQTITRISNIVKNIVSPEKISPQDRGSVLGAAAAAGVSPSASGAVAKKKNESIVKRYDSFLK
jgi:hypothetical protein